MNLQMGIVGNLAMNPNPRQLREAGVNRELRPSANHDQILEAFRGMTDSDPFVMSQSESTTFA